MSLASLLSPADLPAPSTRPVPRPSRGDGWNSLADVEVFVFAVEAELEAMDRERVGVHRRGRKPDLSLRRRLIGVIWMLTFGGMQWRIAGWLSGIPFTTLHSSFAVSTRRGPPTGSARDLPLILQAFFRAPVRTGSGVADGDHHRGRATAAMAG